jgi:hypothetical protein
MDMKRDKVKKTKEGCKDAAVKFIKSWAEKKAVEYNEPSRAGTPKGERIGFSRKKYKAGLLMALYPDCLRLRGIAKISGVSEGVLRVWRTEREFEEIMHREYQRLGESIVETIKSTIEKNEYSMENLANLCFTLPYLNSIVTKPVIQLILKGARSEYFPYAVIGLSLFQFANVHDEKTLREWERKPEILELNKAMVTYAIDLLVEGKIEPETSFEELKNFGAMAKEFILGKLDILAT